MRRVYRLQIQQHRGVVKSEGIKSEGAGCLKEEGREMNGVRDGHSPQSPGPLVLALWIVIMTMIREYQ